MNKKQVIVEEIHKPARRNFQRRKVELRAPFDTFQADLVELIPYSSLNKGYKYLLNVIDIFTKYAWSVPLKTKTGKEVTAAMESILKKSKAPKNLHVDEGREFFNSNFQGLMKKHNINMYITYSGLKASICERFNRTLKNKMWKQFSLQGSYKWLDMLPDLIKEYNSTKHRTIGMKPKDVTAAHTSEILRRINKMGVIKKLPKFKVNEKVRVSKLKNVFDKKYFPNWSTEVFTVTKIKKTNPPVYHLKDYKDQPIAGAFYEEELLKTKCPDVYLVEKVIKKRGNELYVKWYGFDSSHNSWINKKDL